MRSTISLAVEDSAWRKSGVDLALLRTAARLTLARTFHSVIPGENARGAWLAGDDRKGERRELTILLTNDARLRALNARFRDKDAPTNVLAFPAGENAQGYLGDVAIALGLAKLEAATAGMPLLQHTLHLVVHGVLHLLGYDHVLAREALIMERLEVAILAELGIPSPYARAAAAE